jgi:hypothetical protein
MITIIIKWFFIYLNAAPSSEGSITKWAKITKEKGGIKQVGKQTNMRKAESEVF